MNQLRLIPSLSLSGIDLVQTHQFKERQYVGDPLNAVRIFNEKCVQEIAITDIDATRYEYTPDFKLVEDVVSECFMPVTFGGGIRNIETARRLFEIGIEKVAVNSGWVDDPELLPALCQAFGGQSIVAVVDIDSGQRSCVDYRTGQFNDNLSLVPELFTESGVGEIRINDVSRDGTLMGMNLELAQSLSSQFDVPIVASGGFAFPSDIQSAIAGGLSGIAVGASFVVYGRHRAALISYDEKASKNGK